MNQPCNCLSPTTALASNQDRDIYLGQQLNVCPDLTHHRPSGDEKGILNHPEVRADPVSFEVQGVSLGSFLQRLKLLGLRRGRKIFVQRAEKWTSRTTQRRSRTPEH